MVPAASVVALCTRFGGTSKQACDPIGSRLELGEAASSPILAGSASGMRFAQLHG
jgi:hypothetical protein